MSVEMEWLDSYNDTILMTFRDNWTWAVCDTMREKRQKMLRAVDGKVDFILDFRATHTYIPRNTLSQIRILWKDRHPNDGRVILVGLNPFLTTVSNIFLQLYPDARIKTAIVQTMDEALALVEENRCTACLLQEHPQPLPE